MDSKPDDSPSLTDTLSEFWRDFLPAWLFPIGAELLESWVGPGFDKSWVCWLVVAPAFFYCAVRAISPYLREEAPRWHVVTLGWLGMMFFFACAVFVHTAISHLF